MLESAISGRASYASEPVSLSIKVENKALGKFYYDDFSVDVEKIVSATGIGYCLEIEKDYPSGQKFENIRENKEKSYCRE